MSGPFEQLDIEDYLSQLESSKAANENETEGSIMSKETILDQTSEDPVYLHFKNSIKAESSLVSAKIIERTRCAHNEPRKTIVLTFLNPNKEEMILTYNYLKLLRMHEKGSLPSGKCDESS